ncbi:WD40/YVTN repeat-like-containing domain,Quinoprotein amine dehydrogenase, beta chain- [Cinara cedri]|uniref:Elongator complex protein 1 n=1 Tax=Cinara cedri TaxID=506608 RepID=A0A5E4N7W8_9HEMI|nr:WD40/YVTN repeat-like-containing domain,Quinoprotein amine dehydrogenase, beta chain- [Cinara cedri]
MKNLKIYKSSLSRIQLPKDATSALIINYGEFCYATNNAIYRSNSDLQHQLAVYDNFSMVIDLSTTKMYIDQDVQIVSYAYNTPWNSFVVGCSNGDVLLIQENIVEVAFKCEDVVATILCSPDFERIILLTEHGHVTLVTECFEVLNNFNITETSLAEKTLVNVGWGKKETQFHGSEGKDKRHVNEVIGDGDCADDSVNVCWRSDSLLFAIGYFNKITNLRSIKIFNRDGVLQSISEPLSGIEAVLSWKTTKELISFSQHINEKYCISFMEKNGLKHGEFSIPSTINVKQLLWNHDSSILCIQCVKSNNNYLLFLSCTNYSWQIKKWLTVHDKVITVKWLPDNSLQLITADGTYYILHWVETLCSSSSGTLDWVAVIDDCSILLTPFKQVIIPPPMFDVKLIFECHVDSVLYLPHNQNKNGNDICVVTDDRSIHFYNYKDVLYTKSKTINSILNATGLCNHWFWLNENTLIFSLSEVGNFHFICILKVDNDSINITKHPVDQPIVGIINHKNGALIQLSVGNVLLWNEELNQIDPHINLPEECTCINIMDNKIYALGVSKRLFENDKVILNNIGSFCIRYPFVLAATLNQELIVHNINPTKDSNNQYRRRVESGSKIITVTGNSVILQLPRGNLETIRPRPLTILSAIELIQERKYFTTFDLLRKERINLNIICDLDPLKFIDDLDEFVIQIKDLSWINLFITELDDKNYLNTVYASQFQQNMVEELPNKVFIICSQLINTLNKLDTDKYAFPLLGCYVKLKRFDLALNLASTNNAFLKHLLFLVDVDKLYKTSLAEYNLEMAMQIINNSQLDPKEYVPFLKELEKMECHYMRFTIDDKLGNKESAVKNLVLCEGQFDKWLKYVIDNNLYAYTLTLFNQDQNEYKIIAKHFGDVLYSKMDYLQAALMYNQSTERKKAINSYLKIGFWKEPLELSYELNFSELEMNEIKANILSMLSSTQKFREAADFAEFEMRNTELAVEYSIKAQDYMHALYLARSRSILDTYLENNIKLACINTTQNLISDINIQREKFESFVIRLLEIKVDISNESMSYDNLNDTSSEISSVSSYRTSSTRTSCRSARKQQRKMWNLKKGNFREQPTIVLNLKQIIEKFDKFKDDVKSMCILLIKLEEFDLSVTLQTSLESLQTCILKNKSNIWPVFNETEQIIEDAILLNPLKILPDKSWKLSILE